MDRGVGVAWKKSVPIGPKALPESQLSILAYFSGMSRDKVSAAARQMSGLPAPEPGGQTFLAGLRLAGDEALLGLLVFSSGLTGNCCRHHGMRVQILWRAPGVCPP